MKMFSSKVFLLVVIAILIGVFFVYDLGHFLTLSYVKSQRDQLAMFAEQNFLLASAGYLLFYVLVTALSLPGAAILTIAGGAVFGLLKGTILVSFASTIGATLAFLVSRFLLQKSVQRRFKDKLQAINRGIEREGAFYLFTMRLIPAIPFFVINLVMGLTSMSVLTFFFVSQLGMLPGTLVYVNAGVQVGQLESVAGLLSPELIGSFVLLGIFPLLVKRILAYFKARKVYAAYSKPKTFDYNLVAIGAGAAGLVTSYISAAVKAKVALIEKSKMGGDCLNYGCVPSKALIKSAKVVHYQERAKEFGLRKVSIDFEFSEVMERVQRVISKVEPHDSVERYTSLGVDCIQGTAKITSPWEIVVNGKTITTKNIVIATGAAPFIPSIEGLELVTYYTSDTIWEIREKPERLVVLGGGPIGSELAQAFCRLGCQVTQIDRGSRILHKEDDEASAIIQETFQLEGITFLPEHSAVRCEVRAGKQFLICVHQGVEKEYEFDALLVAVGRAPRTRGYGLEELGIPISERGTVEVNQFLQTKYPNIYACGDVAGPYQFTHFAAHQAWYCAVNALFGRFKKYRADYSVVPRVTYTDPEVASVGLTEKAAQAEDVPYEVVCYSLDDLDRAITEDEDRGFVKLLVVPKSDKILGVTIVGYNAGEYISEFVTAMKHGLGLNKILGTIHAYPTFAEANKYAAGAWKQQNKPERLLGYLQRYHQWERGH